MSYSFQSQKELFERVHPALNAKLVEFHRLGFLKIKDIDIWNYLVETKWKNGQGLMLSDIVSDIMNTECKKMDAYLKEKNKQ